MTSPTDLHEVCQNEPGCCQLSHARAESIRLKKKKKKKDTHGCVAFTYMQAWHYSDKASQWPSLERPGPKRATDEERSLY
ncbi:hypothetical protein CTAM01_13957 [Colletotrichum tamarilloi]|uniref:Uncharacterized protein n=1 Tax=Colletotrichum tamarilloi TaxID=1209934 RepID=A0ABQ9QQN5_9PEZI|nr:uncharacterized protein CTAM01_13957 [Colletotrichum tamarilloi]KAK1481600.1 hypothetical protein CTAM01_13957 [Colletotrichum tamarilloi]